MVFFFSTAFATIFANIGADLVTERNDHIKHQLIVSGTSWFAYWAAQYLFD